METQTVPEKAPPGLKKRIIPRQVRSFHNTVFVVGKAPESQVEQDLPIHFGCEVPYRVVKLGTRNLPRADSKGNRITWINNFGVMDSKGNYVDGVKYTVLLPALPGKQVYVTYLDGQVQDLMGVVAQPVESPPAHMIQVEFTRGDPPIGIRSTSEGEGGGTG